MMEKKRYLQPEFVMTQFGCTDVLSESNEQGFGLNDNEFWGNNGTGNDY